MSLEKAIARKSSQSPALRTKLLLEPNPNGFPVRLKEIFLLVVYDLLDEFPVCGGSVLRKKNKAGA